MFVRDSIHDLILGSQISNNIWKDNNGQLICENVVLARTGSYDYREDELFKDGSPDKIVKVYRRAEDVFDPVSIKSMNYKPLCDDHPEDNVTPETVSELQKGFMINVRRGTGEFSECLMADLVVTDPYVIEEIESKKKRDLSVGYTADIVEEGGKYYMKNIRGNHIALCQAGRAGNARIRDSKAVMDVEAKGSFNSIEELVKHYKGATTEANGDKVVVRLSSGSKLLYSYVSGSDGKLVFVRKMKDSNGGGSVVEVIGDSVKLREGQRVVYFGTPCRVISINPNLKNRQFMVEFGADGVLCGRLPYDEVTDYVGQGKIKLLDSVVFDSDTGEFVLQAEDADTEITKFNGKHTDPAHEKELDRTHYTDADSYFDLEYSYSGDSTSDYRGHARVKAGSLQEAITKLKKAKPDVWDIRKGSHYSNADVIDSDFEDAPKMFTLYSPSQDEYVEVNTRISGESMSGIRFSGKGRAQRWSSSTLAEAYAITLNEVLRRNGFKGDFKAVPLNDAVGSALADSSNATVKEVEQALKKLGLQFVREGKGWTGSVGQVYKSTEKFKGKEDFTDFMKKVDRALEKFDRVTFNGGLSADGTLSLTVSFHGIKDSAASSVVKGSTVKVPLKNGSSVKGTVLSVSGGVATVRIEEGKNKGFELDVATSVLKDSIIADDSNFGERQVRSYIRYYINQGYSQEKIAKALKEEFSGVRPEQLKAAYEKETGTKVEKSLFDSVFADVTLSGRYVSLEYSKVKGKNLKQEIEKAYNQKFYKNIKVTKINKHYVPGKKELEIQVFATGMHEDFDGFWAVVYGGTEQEMMSLRDSAENLKSFSVKVGDRTFVTKANNSAEAVLKVKDSLKVADMGMFNGMTTNYHNRITFEVLKQTLSKFANDKKFDKSHENIIRGQLSELVGDFKADMSNSKYDKNSTKSHYMKYVNIVRPYFDKGNYPYEDALQDFLMKVK